jgi:raffinose/stachyose/melibiose transport system substrate-binding protein
MKFERLRPRTALVAGAVTLGLVLTACGGSGSSAGGSDGNVTLTFLVNSGETNEAQAKAVVDAFQQENPTITVETSTRPGGTEGDNLIKTKLATGEMEDIFQYNAGSLLQALTPDQTLVNVADQEWVGKLDEDYKESVSTANGTYGAPWNSSMAGGILYNKDIYAELGLKVPTTWDEFIANSQKIKESGKAAPIVQSYGDGWTSQMWILADFFNVSAQNPDWAQQYT